MAALVLTHGHEDHIGGVPYVWPLVDGPVYGTPLTLALVEPKLEEHQIDPGDRLVTVAARRPRRRRRVHDRVPARHAQHSRLRRRWPSTRRPERSCTPATSRSTRRRSTASTWTCTASRRWDRKACWRCSPTAPTSTGRGFTGSEIEVVGAFEEIFTSATGHAGRRHVFLEPVSDADPRAAGGALRAQGRVCGPRRWCRTRRSRSASGTCRCRRACRSATARSPTTRPSQVLCISTGTQGEPRSALSRIAVDDHRHVKIGPGDTVVLSARAIPGNEKAIGRVINHLTRRGAEIVTDANQARARLRARQRGRDQARPLAGASAVLRAGARRVSATWREHRRIAERVTRGSSVRWTCG